MPAALTGPAPALSLPLPRKQARVGWGQVAATIDPGRASLLFSHKFPRTFPPIPPIPPLGAEEGSLRLGVPALDDALQGGIALGALHELAPTTELQLGAALGFGLGIAALAAAARQSGDRQSGGSRQVLCIQTDYAALAAGTPYGLGLEDLGLAMDRLLILRVAHPRDALWAFEEALKCPALAAVLAELPEAGVAADLTATRRLGLAAQRGGGLGLLLRHRLYPLPSAAMTRWQIAAAASEPDRFGGLGGTRFDLSLNRNRRGRCGRWIAGWNHDERTFVPQALSVGMAETARDRSDRARPLLRTA
jgi:protein ImuA